MRKNNPLSPPICDIHKKGNLFRAFGGQTLHLYRGSNGLLHMLFGYTHDTSHGTDLGLNQTRPTPLHNYNISFKDLSEIYKKEHTFLSYNAIVGQNGV